MARKITLSARQRSILEGIVASPTAMHRLVVRARIVLMSGDGRANNAQASELGVHAQLVWRWRRRWAKWEARLAEAESKDASEKELTALIARILSDEYRAGTTPKFTAEQITQIIAVACESPEESNIPVSHWTPQELTTEVIKRGIVPSISPRHLDRFLKGGGRTAAQGRVLDEAQRRGSRTLPSTSRTDMRSVPASAGAR
jgi:transposase